MKSIYSSLWEVLYASLSVSISFRFRVCVDEKMNFFMKMLFE